jgi:tRNA(fMet)-specific endonuclease VapC
MRAVALDTNAYANFKRGDRSLVEQLSRAERVYIPVPVLAELRVGFRGGSKEAPNLDELEQFLASPRVSISPLGEQTAILYAEIFGTLRRNGTPIPLNDVWIAASAMETGSILLSADSHFSHIAGLLLNVPL